ncbi:hypothetical protein GGI07_001528 [Coemansia sp. Benny D115]|nr:hypothetical protein GGI07_001528 [Coemansia sp. Benny D115]
MKLTFSSTLFSVLSVVSIRYAAAQASAQDYVPCTSDGEVKCIDDFHFMTCDHGYWRASTEVAPGTFCLNDIIVNADSVPKSLIPGMGSDGNENGASLAGDDGNGDTDVGGVEVDVDAGSSDEQFETVVLTSCDEDQGSSEQGEVGADGGVVNVDSGNSGDSDMAGDSEFDDAESGDSALNIEVLDSDSLSSGDSEQDILMQMNDKEDSTSSKNGASNLLQGPLGAGFGAFVSLASAVVIASLF